MSAYEQALQKLHQTRLDEFVGARKRLAAELRGKGDAAGAAELAKRRRPTISAWTVNQLYWRARDAFDAMIAAAKRVRRGDLGATNEYREAIARLRKGAERILEGEGHGVTDAVLRRVAATLAAIAVSGFDPDPPGTLVADRDPPGFEAAALSGTAATRRPRPEPQAAPARRGDRDVRDDRTAGRARAAADRARRAAEEAEEKRRRAEAARRKAERGRIEKRLRAARVDVARRERALASREKELRAVGEGLETARALVRELDRKARELDAR